MTTYQMPNLVDVAYIDLAEPDAGDFAVIAERTTGVLSGCLVTAQGVPALAVDVAGGNVVVGGVPTAVASGSLAVVAGEANPRFDLVVVDSGGVKSIIKGTSSTNPRWPVFNPTLYCLLSALYVRQSVSAILGSDVLDKRVAMAASFSRIYANGTTEVLGTTDNTSTPKKTSILSDGTIKWVSSILRRTADATTEFATSMVMKAADSAQNAVLTLQARATTPSAQHPLSVTSSGGTELTYITGDGLVSAQNFQGGSGSPEGVVFAPKGALYINVAFADADAALFIKTTAVGANTGWQAMKKNVALTARTGQVFPYIGDPSAPPTGAVYLNGQNLSATATANVPLYNMILNRHGGTPGVNFNVPDYRGFALVGAGGTMALNLGDIDGASTVALVEANNGPHDHDVDDPEHVHPFPGFAYVWKPPSEPTFIKPYPAQYPPVTNTMPYMDIVPFGFDYSAPTGITVEASGSGTPFSVVQPSAAVHWMVWL